MFSVLIVALGFLLAAVGFLAMRNPMVYGFFAPGREGYYQRMVLDRYQRIQLRLVSMFFSFFGLMLLTNALKGVSRFNALDALADGFLVLLSISFITVFGVGLIYSIVQLVRGRMEQEFQNWFRMWKEGIELGPIAVCPAITPRMKAESRVFTLVYCTLIALTVIAALLLAG
jgi:hypothetical protein